MKALLLILIFSTATVALAESDGPGHGGGGNVMLCRDSEGDIKATPVDYWEATLPGREMSIDLGEDNLSVEAKVELALSRIKRLNPTRYQLYKEWANNFFSEVKWEKDPRATLHQIDDVGSLAVPGDCWVWQTISQENPDLPGLKRYTILEHIWKLLDNNGQAGMILHEIILRELKNQRYPHETSKYARYFNRLISSTKITGDTTLKEYLGYLQQSKFATGDAQNQISINTYNCSQCPPNIEYWNETTVKNAAEDPQSMDKFSSINWLETKVLAQYYTSYINAANNSDTPSFRENGDMLFFRFRTNQKFSVRHATYKMDVTIGEGLKPSESYGLPFFGKDWQNGERYGLASPSTAQQFIPMEIRVACSSGKDIYLKTEKDNHNIAKARIFIEINPETGEIPACNGGTK